MAVYLPITSTAAWIPDLRVLLDGTFYRFDFSWNETEGYWAVTLSQDDASPLFQGLRLTLGVNMLRQFVDEAFPPGALVLVDTSGQGIEPGRDDLSNGRVRVVYRTAAEVASGT